MMTDERDRTRAGKDELKKRRGEGLWSYIVKRKLRGIRWGAQIESFGLGVMPPVLLVIAVLSFLL